MGTFRVYGTKRVNQNASTLGSQKHGTGGGALTVQAVQSNSLNTLRAVMWLSLKEKVGLLHYIVSFSSDTSKNDISATWQMSNNGDIAE